MKKLNFRKIAALGGSLLLTGMSLGVASAAAYPAPFVSGGSANVAIVYGTGAGVSALDTVQAGNIQKDLVQAGYIQTDLQGYLGTGSSGGIIIDDGFQIKRTGNEFNLGDNANTIRDTIRKDQLPTLLADGTYLDDNNDEYDTTQKIELSSNLALTHFRDSDLDNVPTIGIQLSSSGTEVLNYTFDFQSRPDFTSTALETTNIEFLGKEYFISSVGSNSITLLDSASTSVLNQGESTTISSGGQSYEVSIQAISSSGVIFSVNGQTTNRLSTGDTYKLPDGSHIGVKDFQQAQFQGDTAFAEFSIGAGKIVLTEGAEVELNDDTVEGLTVVASSMNDSAKFKGFKLQWKTSDRSFITPEHELTMPGFESVKLSMTEFYTPSEEVIRVEDSGTHIDITLPLGGGSVTLPLLYHNESTAAIKGIGESDDKKLITSNTNVVTFNATAGHEWFVASWEGSTDAYSEVFRVSSVNSDNETSLTALGSGTSYSGVVDGGSIVAGDVELQIDVIERTSSSEFALNITNLATTTAGAMRNIYTEDGLKIYLPYNVGQAITTNKGDLSFNLTDGVAGYNNASWYLFMDEQDKDQALANGGQIRLTLTPRSASDETIHVSAVAVNATTGSTTGSSFGTGTNPTLRVESSDDYVGYVQSELASMISWDKSGDEQTATITYHDEESYGRIFLAPADATASGGASGGALGDILVRDSEVSSVSTMNLIVIGGSCINSAAASLVGGEYCGAMFTENTGVGSGQFLIKGYSDSSLTSRMALLVAGYEASDTVNAATYLRNQKPDTSQTLIGTSSTSATLQTSSA
jgi:hypothetical protein